MIKKFLVLFTIAAAFSLPRPTDCLAADYTLQGDYWVKDGLAYTRKRVPVYKNGCRCHKCTSYRYEYKFHHKLDIINHDTTQRKYVSPQDVNWRAKLLELAEQRQEDESFVIWHRELLGKNPYAEQNPFYSLQNQYSLNASSYKLTTPLGQQGSTTYGYPLQQQSGYGPSAFKDLDIQLMLNQANNLAQSGQDLGGKATQNFSAIVSQVIDESAAIEKIESKGKETERILGQIKKILEEPSVQEEVQTNIEISPNKPQPDNSHQPNQGDISNIRPLSSDENQNLLQIVKTKCYNCHNAEKTDRLNLENYNSLSKQDKYKVVQSIQGELPDVPRMPEGREPLPDQEVLLFIRDYLTTK